MKRPLIFLASYLALFLLLYLVGIIRASKGYPGILQLDPNNYGISYYFNTAAKIQVPTDQPEAEASLADKGLPLPPGAYLYPSEAGFHLVGPHSYHQRLQQWLTQTEGQNWQWDCEERLNLYCKVAGRVFGLVELDEWSHSGSRPIESFGPPERLTVLALAYNEGEHYYLDRDYFTLTSQYFLYYGPSWPLILVLTLGPAAFIYFLRKPIWRAATAWRRTKPTAVP